jgi:predicted Fe-S protein YdhL (DUF1289 family)
MRKKISTPCVGLCDVDSKSQLCRGCRRSLAEICRWGEMSETERLAIMSQLAGRGSILNRSGDLPQRTRVDFKPR